MAKKCLNNKGFTLAELMIAAIILAVTFVGMLLTYLRCMELNEISRNSSLVIQAATSELEDIKNTPFSQVFANHNGTTFTVAGINGIGVVTVDNTNADLLEVVISFSWRQSNGRLLGEDADLDGQLDGGEDQNGNGRLDSPVDLISYIYDS